MSWNNWEPVQTGFFSKKFFRVQIRYSTSHRNLFGSLSPHFLMWTCSNIHWPQAFHSLPTKSDCQQRYQSVLVDNSVEVTFESLINMIQHFHSISSKSWYAYTSHRKAVCSKFSVSNYHRLVGWFLWHINLCRLFNAKSIFIKISRFISNNSI